ncbi:MAG: OsmC family protein [Ignavibacteria bacterium]|nr:OsmC family protein [Ignavibacteria bacterium]
MNDKFEVNLELKNDKLLFIGNARDNHNVSMDYFPPLGDGMGYTGLELLLMSFAGCSATSIIFLLRKMGKNIKGMSVSASGIKRDEMPKAFKEIHITYTLTSDNTEEPDVRKAISLSEESVCPVWSMIKGNVEIFTYIKISK